MWWNWQTRTLEGRVSTARVGSSPIVCIKVKHKVESCFSFLVFFLLLLLLLILHFLVFLNRGIDAFDEASYKVVFFHRQQASYSSPTR